MSAESSEETQEMLNETLKNAMTNMNLSNSVTNSKEENILELKSHIKSVTSKIIALHSSSLKNKASGISDEEFKEVQNKFLESMVNKELASKLYNVVYLGKAQEDLCKHKFPEDSEVGIFQNKIVEQLTLQKKLCDEIKELTNKQRSVFNETINLSQEVRLTQADFKTGLLERKQKLNEPESEEELRYKQKMNHIEKRLVKINFMNILTKRLLIYGGLDYEKHKEFIPIIERSRYSYNIDSFKD